MRQQPLVLIVDDMEDSAVVLEYTLQRAGVRVITASNALECVRLCRQQRPDLILMDVMMPGLDGATAAGSFQDTPELQGIPIVLMSAMEEDALRERAKDAGAVDYLVKPFRREKLLSLIYSWLSEPWKAALSAD